MVEAHLPRAAVRSIKPKDALPLAEFGVNLAYGVVLL
jgi:hypothetical protein